MTDILGDESGNLFKEHMSIVKDSIDTIKKQKQYLDEHIAHELGISGLTFKESTIQRLSYIVTLKEKMVNKGRLNSFSAGIGVHKDMYVGSDNKGHVKLKIIFVEHFKMFRQFD